MRATGLIATAALNAAVLACSDSNADETEGDPTTLAGKYSRHFTIGAAMEPSSIETHGKLLTTHFNSVTAENSMKFESLQRGLGGFNFTLADQIVDFALENDMAVRGHALIWHRQNPWWLFEDADRNRITKDELLGRMEDHITTVMQHYSGKVQHWDVVNEAIMNDGRLRTEDEEQDDQKSLWHGIIGEEYIARAFEFAHAADPDAKLFYNDYYNYLPARRDAIYQLLSDLLDDGVPVHGVGLQCHLNIEPSSDPEHQSHYQTIEELEQTIELYASLGLDIHITELDVSLYIGGTQYEEEDFYTEDTFTTDIERQQAERYRDLFALFRKHRDVIGNVTFWGVADDDTWLSEFDSGRTDFPLLFDVDHEPKAAFDAVMDF